MLTFGALGAAAFLGAGSAVLTGGVETPLPVTMTPEVHASPVAVERTQLQTHTSVASAAYVYEVDGQPTAFYSTSAFGARLERWFATHLKETGQRPDEVRSFGAWTPGAEGSWHGSGEAFDVARLRAGGKDLVSARYDKWRDDTAAEVRTRLRLYWRLAAGLHLEFADVVTYLYDSNHSNHIHVDTGRFGPNGAPRLIPRSEVQVQAVQAMCRHVWGRSDVEITGRFDAATRDATSKVIADHGGEHAIDDGVEGWRAFLLPTLRAG
ncbi:MAG: extensin family protein [Intrasporangium sp.]|uniref:extensin family protein n=1 Tax=Intrasporangium sp. TaxID=1925024 RepID=UPI003F7D27B3